MTLFRLKGWVGLGGHGGGHVAESKLFVSRDLAEQYKQKVAHYFEDVTITEEVTADEPEHP